MEHKTYFVLIEGFLNNYVIMQLLSIDKALHAGLTNERMGKMFVVVAQALE